MTTYHVQYSPDETFRPLCNTPTYGATTTSTTDPLAAAVKIEDEGKPLCGNCKRIIRARFGSIRRWDNEDAA